MGWRAVAILVLALMLGSAGSGIGTAAVGVTKKKADRKFLQNTTIVTQAFTVPPSPTTATTAQVSCPAGWQATGGGADSPVVYGGGGSDAFIIFESRPILAGARAVGWYVEVVGTGAAANGTIYAVCSK
jgi:hypothetical protein